MAREVDTTKSGYLTFDPGGMSTVNCRPPGGQVSESTRSPRGKPSLYPSHNPTGSSAIPIKRSLAKG